MAQKNRADLTTQANVIKNETIARRNTALRVGNMNIDEIDSFLNFNSDPDVQRWYLSEANGDDSNVGSTATKPFENVQIALDAATAGDIIEILDMSYSKSGAFAFSKDVTIVGPAGYNGTNAAKISGQFTITGGANLQFQNININGASIISIVGNASISMYNSRLVLTTITADVIDLELHLCRFNTSNAIALRTLEMRSSEGGTFAITVNGAALLYDSHYLGDIETGTGGTANLTLINATIDGDVVSSGQLNSWNSVISGTLAITGITTGGSRFPGQVAAQGLILSSTATPEIDFNKSICQQMTVDRNVTAFTTINEFSPVNCDVYLVNDGTAGRTVAAPTDWTADPTSETHTTAANAINRYQFYTTPSGIKLYNLHISRA